MTRRFACLAGLCALALGSVMPALAQSPSPANAVYDPLRSLSADVRRQRLVEGAQKESKLVVVHALSAEEARRQVASFQKQYPFLEIDLTNLGSQDAVERLLAEETAGRHLTDVVNIALPDASLLTSRGLLARLPSNGSDMILPAYRIFVDPEARWVPWLWNEHGISYNVNLVPADKAPTSWFSLCDPFFKHNASYDPLELRFLSGLYAILGEAETEKLIKCIGENEPIIQRGHTQRMQLMLAGDHMIQGDNYLYSGLSIKRRQPSTPYAIAKGPQVMAYAAVATVNANAPHPYASALYVDWLLGEESQKFVASLLRGPVTDKHPFLTDAFPVVPFRDPDAATLERLAGYWRKYVDKR